MKTYIGVKIVQAEPLTLGAYNERRGWQIPANEDPARPGYFLTYPDGYISWSPAEVFDGAYREISADERALCGVNVITPEPSTFMSRLIVEHNELEDRLAKLGLFVDANDAFYRLPISQQELLRSQRAAMTQYLEALNRRMVLLGAKPIEPAGRMDHDAGDRDEILETRVTGGGSSETPIPFREDEKPAPAPGTKYKPDGFA